jgi:hypothetical protein
MRHLKKSVVASIVFASITSAVQADVGVLDKYECHKHQETKKYHCHGPADLAKMGGVIVGADARTLVWSTAGGILPFIGVAVNAEYNYNWIAVSSSYYYMPMVTDITEEDVSVSSAITLQGWQAGVKVGPGVGRLGSKMFLAAGWNAPTITDSENSQYDRTLAGYYVGAGFGVNTNTLAIDVSANYYDPTKTNTYLIDRGAEADATVVDARVSVGWRF